MNVDLINPKNNLLKSQKFSDILALLKLKIAEYPPNRVLKQCNEFLLYVCKIVEEVIVKGDKLDKKEFVIDLFKQLLSLKEPETKLVSSSIEFLWFNGIISKIKTSKRVWNILKRQFHQSRFKCYN